MKIYIIFGLMWLLVSCKQEPLFMFNEKADRLQIPYGDITDSDIYTKLNTQNEFKSEIKLNLGYMDYTATVDTVYVIIKVMGNISDKDRIVNIKQVKEENLIEGQKTAEAGKHFVPFENKDYIIAKEKYKVTVPIILKRHDDLLQVKYNQNTWSYDYIHSDEYRLKLRIVDNDDFDLMHPKEIEVIIVFYDNPSTIY